MDLGTGGSDLNGLFGDHAVRGTASAKYLPFYLNEFSFRFNNPRNEDMLAI
jgi:hypothetical protein